MLSFGFCCCCFGFYLVVVTCKVVKQIPRHGHVSLLQCQCCHGLFFKRKVKNHKNLNNHSKRFVQVKLNVLVVNKVIPL